MVRAVLTDVSFVCVSTHVCMYVCMYVCIYVYMNNDTIDTDVQRVYAQIEGDHGTCVYIYVCTYMYVCMYIYEYMYTCMYVHI
jgi:hypothetical protein